MNELDQAISKLYEAFRSYPLKSKIDFSPLLDLDSEEALLHTRPLRELLGHHFGSYPVRAMSTFGDDEDFKHFLPRMLELYARYPWDLDCPLAEIIRKIRWSSWETWPETEKLAIRQFLDAWRRDLTTRQQDSTETWGLEEFEKELEESGFEAWGAT